MRLTLTICGEIRLEQKKLTIRNHAITRNYPTQINFTTLTARILIMKRDLNDVMNFADAKEAFNVWACLEDDLEEAGQTLQSLARLKHTQVPASVRAHCRPG
jgi:hypothetical protein